MNKNLLAAGGVIALVATITTAQIDTKTVESVKLTAVEEIKTKAIGQEIESLRKENMEVFKAKDGQLQAKVYIEPKYYFDSEDSTFKQPDLTVKEISTLAKLNPLKTHDRYVDAGFYKAVWFDKSPNNYAIYGEDDSYIGYTALFDTVKVKGTTERKAKGIKQTYTIADETVSSISWLVKSNLHLITAGKAIIGRDNYGVDRMVISEPVAWDANKTAVPMFVYLNADTLKYAVFPAKGTVYPIIIDPTTTINNLDALSGYLTSSNSTYLTGRNATSASASSGGYILMGQNYGAPTYYIYRSYLAFVIPPLVSVSSCSVSLYGDTDISTTDFNINIFGARSYRSTLTTADFNKFNGWASSGAYGGTALNDTWSSASYSATWNTITFNAAGRDSVVAAKGDTLWIALLSSRDVAATQPSGWEAIQFKNSVNLPYLSLTYLPVGINAPSDFLISPVTGAKDSLLLSWTKNYSDNIDSLIVYQWPDSVRIASITKTLTSYQIGGLNPYHKYKFYVRADSAHYYGYSNADSCYTCQTFKTENFPFTNYGYTQNVNTAVYDSVRTESKTDSLTNGGSSLGQWKTGSAYYIFRHFQDILIPKLTKIKAESLFVKGTSDISTTDFNINVYSGFWKGGTPTNSKYFTWDGWHLGMTAYSGSLLNNTFSTASFTTGATYNKIVFNQAGRDSTLKAQSDTLQIILLSSKDVSGTAPTNGEFVLIDASNSYLRLTYAPPDSAPTGFTITAISEDSLLASWSDHSYSERGFIVVDETTGIKIAGSDTTGANATSLRIGGLLPNRGYGMKVKAVGGGADGLISSADSCYTLPGLPVISPLTFPADSLLKIVIDTTDVNNPFYTEYALQDSLSGKFIKIITGIDTFSTDTTWATLNLWGAENGDTVRVGVGKKYNIRVKARSGQ